MGSPGINLENNNYNYGEYMSSASDYAFQTLLYVSRLVSEGDFKTAECMGLSNEQMSTIGDLSTQDIHVLSDLTQAKFLSVQFDQKALDKALVIIGDKKRHQHKIYELLKKGASYPVMKYLYGLTTSDMANYKKFLNLPKSEGRPSLPSEDKQHNLWKHITHVDIHIKTEELADKLLHASKATNLQINVIWLVLNKWDKDLPEYTAKTVC